MGILQITMKQTFVGQQVRNMLYFEGLDAVQANAQAVGDYLRTMWDTHLKVMLAPTWQLNDFTAREVQSAGLPPIEYSFTAGGVTGAAITEPVASQVAGIVSFKANTIRPNAARNYIAAINSSALVQSQFTAAATNLLFAWGQGVNGIRLAAPLGLDHVSARWNETRTYVTDTNVLTIAIARSVPGTQRRRRIGVGV